LFRLNRDGNATSLADASFSHEPLLALLENAHTND
jgi:hypothetical protein